MDVNRIASRVCAEFWASRRPMSREARFAERLLYLVAEEAKKRKMRVFDFDDTLVYSTGSVSVEKAGGEAIAMDSATFAHFKPSEGDTLNFGDFNDVKKPRIIKKNFDALRAAAGDKETRTVILTARPKGSASAVKKFLESQKVPGVEVVALQSSDPEDKARWVDSNMEGVEDFEFHDDSSRNVAAVAKLKDKHKVRFESVKADRPTEEDFEGAAVEDTFKSDDPTVAKVKFKVTPGKEPAKPAEKEQEKPGALPHSEWWESQTHEFQKEYCREHPASKYCGMKAASEKDPNAGLKKELAERAAKSKSKKVKQYVKVLLEKVDQAGPAAGIWMEQLERDFGKLKPEGHLKGWEESDFGELYVVLTGAGMKKASLSELAERVSRSIAGLR